MRPIRLALITPMAAIGMSCAHAQDGGVQYLPDQLKWNPSSIAGVQVAPLAGALDKPVYYTYRVKLEKGAIVQPHTHPDARYVTVLSGTLYAGHGDTVGDSTATPFPAGSFFMVPVGVVHYSWAKDGEVVYQESGIGPTATNFLKK